MRLSTALAWLSTEVVFIAWDPHPQKPVEGMLLATSMLELVAELADSRAEEKMSSDSPFSHCHSLRWLWSHVVVLGVRLQLGQAVVVRAFLWYSVGALSCSSREGGFACGPSTLCRSEMAMLVVRRPSHMVALWSPSHVCVTTLVGGRGVALFWSLAGGGFGRSSRYTKPEISSRMKPIISLGEVHGAPSVVNALVACEPEREVPDNTLLMSI
ncbi:hypothetical protein Taro_013842, partial [Colocasia esculenta]|nr:hypothetical protein [Colocasia esculenta]